MKRDEVLDKAKEIIGGPRAEEYGDAFENFTRILEGWNIIVNEAHKHQGYITARHVAPDDLAKDCQTFELAR